MAASPSALPKINDPEIEKHVEELEKAKTQEEYESKLGKIGFSVANWMKLLFNRAEPEEFHAEWLTVSVFHI